MGVGEGLRSLLPPGGPISAAEALDSLDLGTRAPQQRPYVALNMVESLDGHARRDGRSGGLSDASDRELFHRMRAQADAVMAGAGTVRAERYGPIVRDAELLTLRRSRGLAEQPLAVIVSRSLALDPELRLLADPGSHVVVLTGSTGMLPPCAAQVDYLRGEALGPLLCELRTRFGVRLIVCEGGPTLNATLLAEGLVDELFLSIAPVLVGGEDPLKIVGPGAPPVALELLWLLEQNGQLHARYAVTSASGRR